MSKEFWKKIEQLRVAQRMLEKQTSDLSNEPAQKPLVTQSYRDAALNIIQSIFEDLKRNTPDIKSKPLSRVRRDNSMVVLEWGNKLEMTLEDNRKIEQAQNTRYPYMGLVVDGHSSNQYSTQKGYIIGFDRYKIIGAVQYYDRFLPPEGIERYAEIVTFTDGREWAGRNPEKDLQGHVEQRHGVPLEKYLLTEDFVKNPNNYLDRFASLLNSASRGILIFWQIEIRPDSRWNSSGGIGPGY